LRPVDEQFLISCRKIDWATSANILMGGAVMAIALADMHWRFDPARVVVFLMMFVCGTAIAYSFMLLLTSVSVWMVRNQSLMEMWWLFTSLARYPREIFFGASWAEPIGLVFTFALPILLVVNVPANAMVRVLDWRMVGFTLLATAASCWASRRFFQHALRSYRSASS
jgi:ABC-2 type transport system permease protein